MQVIEAPYLLALAPHDHLHIKQKGTIKRWSARAPQLPWPSQVQPNSYSGSARAPSGEHNGLSHGIWAVPDQGGEYSREVPQQTGIRMDPDARPWTVTCGYGRGWTVCLLFASRGSGIRVPLAPQVRGIIRTPSPRVQQQSTATGTACRCRTRVRVGVAHPCGGAQVPGLGPSSGPLSRKNASGGRSAACPAASGQWAESVVPRPAPAAQAEGQQMAGYFITQE